MKIPFFIFISYIFMIKEIKSIDTYFNFNTGLGFRSTIKNVVTKNISSTQYVFIYYADNTISKLSNTLVQQSSVSLGSKVLTTFGVYQLTIPYYYGVVSGGNEILMININDFSFLSIKKYTNIIQFQLLHVYSPSVFDALIYRQDVALRVALGKVFSTINFTTTTTRNYIQKIIKFTVGTNAYQIIFTSLKSVYLLTLTTNYLISIPIYHLTNKTIISNFSSICNLSIISYVLDLSEIAIVQFSNFSLYAFHILNGSSVTINVNIRNIVGSSIIKKISPNLLVRGERIFIFHDKSMHINLTNTQYSFLSYSQSAFSVTNWTNVISLTTNYSFVYSIGSNYAYSYCQKSAAGNLTGCTTNISCSLTNCINCAVNKTACVTCIAGYAPLSGVCSPILPCTVINCSSCNYFNICLVCNTNYTLNTIGNSCIQNVQVLSNTSNITLPSNVTQPILAVDNTTNTTNASILQLNVTDITVIDINITNSTILNETNFNIQNNTSPLNGSTNFNSTNNTNPIPLNNTNSNSNQFLSNITNSSNNANINSTNNKKNDSKCINCFTNKRVQQTHNSFKSILKQFNTFVTVFNSIPGSRVFFSCLTPIFGFFDDYWYYLYHQDSYPQLQIMPNFLVFMYKANDQRIQSKYLNFDNIVSITPLINSNYLNYTNFQISQLDNQQTYFFQNIQSMLFEQYIILAVLIIIIKSVTLMMRAQRKIQHKSAKKQKPKLQNLVQNSLTESKKPQTPSKIDQSQSNSQGNYCRVIQLFRKYLQEVVSLKSIFIMLIGANLIFISFYFSCQLRIMFTFDTVDLGNASIALLFGFIVIAFILGNLLYDDIEGRNKRHKYIQKRDNINKLRQISEQKRQCLYSTYFINLKNLFFGFVHGFFIEEPIIQYYLLISIKSYLLYIILYKKKLVRHTIVRVLIFVYFLSGIGIDLLCLVSRQLLISDIFMIDIAPNFDIINLMETICLLSISISLFLQVVCQVIFPIYDLFCLNTSQNEQERQKRPNTIFKLLRRVVPENNFNQNKLNQKSKHIKSGTNQLLNQISLNSMQHQQNKIFMNKIFHHFNVKQKQSGAQIQNSMIKSVHKSKIRMRKTNKKGNDEIQITSLRIKFKKRINSSTEQTQMQDFDKAIQKPYPKSYFRSQQNDLTEIETNNKSTKFQKSDIGTSNFNKSTILNSNEDHEGISETNEKHVEIFKESNKISKYKKIRSHKIHKQELKVKENELLSQD